MQHYVWSSNLEDSRTQKRKETQPFALRNSPFTWDIRFLHMIISFMIGTECDKCPRQVSGFDNRRRSVQKKEGKIFFSLKLKGDVIDEPVPTEFNYSSSIFSWLAPLWSWGWLSRLAIWDSCIFFNELHVIYTASSYAKQMEENDFLTPWAPWEMQHVLPLVIQYLMLKVLPSWFKTFSPLIAICSNKKRCKAPKLSLRPKF